MASLVVVEGAGAGKTYDLKRALILGRQKGVDLLVDDIGASREHCKVFLQDGEWCILDLGSRNGTKVNGAKVSRQALGHGDTILIGKTAIRFDAPEQPSRRPAAAPPSAAPAAAGGKPPSAGAATGRPKGPGALDRERERLRAAATQKVASGPRAKADDGSGIVITEKVLQYGRIEDKGGFFKEDVGQRGPIFKIGLAIVFLGVGAGIVWGIVKALDRPVVESPDEPSLPGGR